MGTVSLKVTLPETNSSPLKINGWKTSFLLVWLNFRGELLVSGRVMDSSTAILCFFSQKNPSPFTSPSHLRRREIVGCMALGSLNNEHWRTNQWSCDHHTVDGSEIWLYNQLRLVVFPIMHKVLAPSQVVQDSFHQQYFTIKISEISLLGDILPVIFFGSDATSRHLFFYSEC